MLLKKHAPHTAPITDEESPSIACLDLYHRSPFLNQHQQCSSKADLANENAIHDATHMGVIDRLKGYFCDGEKKKAIAQACDYLKTMKTPEQTTALQCLTGRCPAFDGLKAMCSTAAASMFSILPTESNGATRLPFQVAVQVVERRDVTGIPTP